MAAASAKPDQSERSKQRTRPHKVSAPQREILEFSSGNPIARQLLVDLSQSKAPEQGQAAGCPPTRLPISKPSRSTLLSRLKSFLPQLEQANTQLPSESGPGHSDDFLELRAVDDNCSSGSSSGGSDDGLAGNGEEDAVRQPHVVMDLACGILELQDDAAVAAATREAEFGGTLMTAQPHGSHSDASSSDSSDDSEDGSDSGDGGSDCGERAGTRQAGGAVQDTTPTATVGGGISELGAQQSSDQKGAPECLEGRDQHSDDSEGGARSAPHCKAVRRELGSKLTLGPQRPGKAKGSSSKHRSASGGRRHKASKRHIGITVLP